MDNMNRIPRANSFDHDLQNVISNFITDNLDRFLQNDRLRRDTSGRVRNLSRIYRNNEQGNIGTALESLNNNMLLYHINISDYLTSMNRIIDNLERERQENNNNPINRRESLFGRNNFNTPLQTPINNPLQRQNNSENNEPLIPPTLNSRSTYYYRTAPIGESLLNRNQLPPTAEESTTTNLQNTITQIPEISSLRDPEIPPLRTSRISPVRSSGFSSLQNSGIAPIRNTTTQRSPFTMFQYFTNNNPTDQFNSNELMQEYFQNLFENPTLFQNVVVSPTRQQIDNATETILYDSDMNLINHRCPISLEDFQPDERVTRITHCGHTFGESSIQNWFRNHVRCPVCRFDIRDASTNETSDNETNNNITNNDVINNETNNNIINNDLMNNDVMNNETNNNITNNDITQPLINEGLYDNQESQSSNPTFRTTFFTRVSNEAPLNDIYDSMEIEDIYEQMEVIEEEQDTSNQFEDESEEDEYNEDMESYNSLPSPETLHRTTSELSSSTSSTLPPNNIDGFWSEFANNIRDNLNENMETILQSADHPVASRIQIDIPFLNENLDISSNYIFHSSYHLP